MKVPTANVVVAFNKEVMTRLFTAGATYSNLLHGLKGDDLEDMLLFDNQANPNFLSFEHGFGLKMGNQFKLSFIDPQGEFEKRFFTTNIAKEIAGTYELTPEKLQSALHQDATSQEGTKSLELMKDQAFFSDFVKEYEDYYGERKLYIAYGTGDNLDLWSGPHTVTLTGANITVKGPKKIDLRLAGQPAPIIRNQRRGMFNEIIDLDLAGLTSRYTGFSENIEFSNFLPKGAGGQTGQTTYDTVDGFGVGYNPLRYMGLTKGDHLVEQIRLKNEEFTNTFPEIEGAFGDFDFHSIVVDALRMYVQNATNNNNVIVLLPNINLICRQAITDIAMNAKREADPEATPTSPFGQATGLRNAATQFGGLGYDTVRFAYRNDMTQLARRKLFIENFLTSFGLLLNEVPRATQDLTLPPQALPQALPNSFVSAERGRSEYERTSNYYRDNIFQAYIEGASNKGIPDHKVQVDKIIDAINKRSKGVYQIELAVINETDIKVLDFWSERNSDISCYKFPLFGGYTDFSAEKEAIIVGDQALIAEYLYARATLDQQAQADAEEGALTAAEASLSTPLHPLDRQILANKNYQKRMGNILNPVGMGSTLGSFGNISYIPDDFSYTDAQFSDEQKKFIKERRIPVFRMNTTNPNILDLKFNYTNYFTLLKQGYTKAVERKASAVAEGVIPEGVGFFKVSNVGEAAEYLLRKQYTLGMGKKDKQKLIQSLANQLDPELLEALPDVSSEEAALGLAAILDKVLSKNNLFGTIDIDQMLPGSPIDVFIDFANKMFRQQYSLNIKTLPTFYLSTMGSTVQAPCIVFAQDKDIRQTRTKKRTVLNRFFSGQYKIMGFKHSISTGTCHSEFVLTKNAPDFNKIDREEQEDVE